VVGEDGEGRPRTEVLELSRPDPEGRAAELAAAGVSLLVCGGISRRQEAAVRAVGLEVISQVCGPVNEVLGAALSGRLGEPTYLMPGCRGRGGRFRAGGRRGWRNLKGGVTMPRGDGTGPEGKGPLTGRGAGGCAGAPGARPGAPRPGQGRGGGRGGGRGMGQGLGRGAGRRAR